jgi:hypothetical protein
VRFEAESITDQRALATAVSDPVASGGQALRYDRSGTVDKTDQAVEGTGTSITVVGRAGGKTADRVCVRPEVDGVAQGARPQCFGRNATTYSARTFTGLTLSQGIHTISLVGSDITGSDRLFVDYVMVGDGDPSPDPYANPDSVNRKFSPGWTPASNTVHLNPHITCPRFDTGTGVFVRNPGVVLINPDVEKCAKGIDVRAAGFRLLADPDKAGYGPLLQHMRKGVEFNKGSADFEIMSLNGGQVLLRNLYRPITIHAGNDGLIENADIAHPMNIDWDDRGTGSIVGIKGLGDYELMPASDKSISGITVRFVEVRDVFEEGISMDPWTSGPDAMPRGTSYVNAVDPAAGTITFGSTWDDMDPLLNAYVTVNTGNAAGRFFKITAVDDAAQRLTIADPNGYLAELAEGDSATVGAIYRKIVFENNTVDATGSRAGVVFGGEVYTSRMENNLVTGRPDYVYPTEFDLRREASGQTVPQSIGQYGLAGVTPEGSLSQGVRVQGTAYNTIVNNRADYDVSFSVRRSSAYRWPVYQSGNTSELGRVYNDGDYTLLSASPV